MRKPAGLWALPPPTPLVKFGAAVQRLTTQSNFRADFEGGRHFLGTISSSRITILWTATVNIDSSNG